MEEQQDYLNYPQTPWYEEKENWLFIGGGVLLVVLIVVVSVWFVRSRSAARRIAVEEAQVVEETRGRLNGDLAQCENASDAEGCREDEVRQAAAQAGAVELCQPLSLKAYASCVTDVAVRKQDLESCDELEDPTPCRDRVFFAIAKSERHYGGCERIEDETLKGSCRDRLIGAAFASGQSCASTHLSEEACLIIELRAQAVGTSDVSVCDRMPMPSAVEECVADVNESDQDRDGLPAFQEIELGTNPNNADTDGDGFGDLEEVENGYNPLGEGKLNE